MNLVLPPLSATQERILQDFLQDLSQEQSLNELVESLVNKIFDYQSDTNPLSRRRKWCLATIHSREELSNHIRQQLKNSGVNFQQDDEFITGRYSVELREATLWEAWFGIGPGLFGGGLGGIPAGEVDWGDTVKDVSFNSEWEAMQYEKGLERSGADHYTSYFLGSDGKWHIMIVLDNPYL